MFRMHKPVAIIYARGDGSMRIYLFSRCQIPCGSNVKTVQFHSSGLPEWVTEVQLDR